MGTEKNQANTTPIPEPSATPAIPAPSTSAGGGVASTPPSGRGKKRAEVRKYLDLLASGQASAATAMVDPGVPSDQRVFLTDEAMASSTSLLVVEDVVADANEDFQTRQVSATVQVNGESFTHAFTVTKDKPTMGVLNNWTVKNSLAAQVSVDAQGYTQFTVSAQACLR